jgi:predicted tellurium resistance membrane protein TerC
MLTHVLAAAGAAGEAHAETVPPILIGGGIFAVFVLLMFATIAFRSVGNRHAAVEEHSDPHRQHPAKHPGPGAKH